MGTAIFYPVFVQMGLTLVLLIWMSLRRRDAIKAGAVTQADIAVDDTRGPEAARQVSNCYRNQFELPVIFYALCIIAFETGSADYLMIALAWIFAISRIVHAYIHSTSNVLPWRGSVFGLGFLILLIMLVVVAVRLIVGL